MQYSSDQIVAFWTRYVGSLGRGPVTLLHGDAHVGNTYVLPDGSVGFLDWQVVRRGCWSQDVGYFLVGALTQDDRREHERRSEEHTSELQSLMRISYAVFCLNKKNNIHKSDPKSYIH